MSHNRRLAVAAVILTLVILASFALSVPRVREVHEAAQDAPAKATSTPVVTLSDTYRKGTHTLAGSVTAPDACSNVLALATYASSTSSAIELRLTLTPATGICLELATDTAFETTVDAPEDTPIATFLNGTLASTTTP